MWYLKAKQDDRIWFIKGEENEWTVGRGGASLTLPNDRSVSRNHAKLRLSNSSLLLEDNESKYGTYMERDNEKQRKLEPNIEVTLKHLDLVHFGLIDNKWFVYNVNMVTCFSTMKPPSSLLQVFEKIGVKYSENWSPNTTHLTMPTIRLTLKVVSALVNLKLIVTPAFWDSCLNSYENNLLLPDESRYLPSVNESTLNQNVSFDINKERQTLFKDKQLVFFSKSQMSKYKNIVELASGNVLHLSECKITKTQLCSSNYIVIQFMRDEVSQDSQARSQILSEIVECMKSKNLRVIPEAEIGLAILYVSLDKYCNPSFSFAAEIIKSPDNKDDNANKNILAPESQYQTLSTCKSSNNMRVDDTTVNSTLESLTSPESTSTNCRKVRRTSVDSDEPQIKKIALDVTNVTIKKKNNDNADDDMFNFINEPEKIDRPTASTTLNIKTKINKKKKVQQLTHIDDDELFKFIPDQDGKTLQKRFLTGDQNKTAKRFCHDNTKSADTTKSSMEITMERMFGAHRSSFENSKWMSCKEPPPNVIVKKENPECNDKTSDVEECVLEARLKELYLQPAVVIVNKNLIKRKEQLNTLLDMSNGINFKKFSKVKPLNPQVDVIPRSKLAVYHGVSKRDDKARVESESDGDNEKMQFYIMDRLTKPKSKKSRRL